MTAELETAGRTVRERVPVSSGVRGGVRAVGRYLRSVIPALLLWQLSALLIDNHAILPTPVEVAGAFVDLTRSGELFGTVAASLVRLGTAYALAVVVCVPIGVLMGSWRVVGYLIDPVVELLRPISGIAWIPLALIIFGVGGQLVMFIIFYGAAFPLILNTVAGVRAVDPQLTAAARTFGVGRLGRLWQVTFPASLPTILVGCRIAMGTAWMSLIAAELVGAPTGLGFSVEWYRELLMTPKMIASVLTIGVLGYACDVLLRFVTQQLTPWATGAGAGR